MIIFNNIDATMNESWKRFNKYLTSAKQMGFTKSKTWIKSMVNKEFIQLPNHSISQVHKNTFINQLHQLMDLLEHHYSGNWDMHLEISGNNRCYIMPQVIYDKITISNEYDGQHEIKDLCVIHKLNYDVNYGIIPDNLYGTRLTLDTKEANACYLHSHLPSVKMNTLEAFAYSSDFCLGSDAELPDLISEMRGTAFDIGMFDMYFTLTDTFVEWESIEGGPYIKMKNIVTQRARRVSFNQASIIMTYQDVIITALESDATLDITFIYSHGRYRVVDDKRLDDYLKRIILSKKPELKYKVFVKKLHREYYTFPEDERINDDMSSNILASVSEMPFIYFSGRKKVFKVEPERGKKIESEDEYFIYPKLKNYVIENIEQRLYKNAIRCSILREQGESIDA